MDRLSGQIVDAVKDFLFRQEAVVFRTKEGENGEVHLDFRVQSSTGVQVYRLSLSRTS